VRLDFFVKLKYQSSTKHYPLHDPLSDVINNAWPAK